MGVVVVYLNSTSWERVNAIALLFELFLKICSWYKINPDKLVDEGKKCEYIQRNAKPKCMSDSRTDGSVFSKTIGNKNTVIKTRSFQGFGFSI